MRFHSQSLRQSHKRGEHSIKSAARGFTLVELLVSLGLFIIVMTLALGGLVSVLDMNTRVRSLQVVVNNFNYTLESITRDIRFGHNPRAQNCAFSDADPCTITVDFEPDGGAEREISYRFSEETIDSEQIGRIERCNIENSSNGNDCTDDDYVALTSSSVDISKLFFAVQGVGEDGFQPRVVMRTEGVVRRRNIETDFTIQTLVNQRQTEEAEL